MIQSSNALYDHDISVLSKIYALQVLTFTCCDNDVPPNIAELCQFAAFLQETYKLYSYIEAHLATIEPTPHVVFSHIYLSDLSMSSLIVAICSLDKSAILSDVFTFQIIVE